MAKKRSEQEVDIAEFVKLMKEKEPLFTNHAKQQCEKRSLPDWAVLNDLQKETPKRVFEQESETEGERKLNVYYHQQANYYHRYVIVINDNLRIITVLRVSKELQKRGEPHENGKV